MLFMVWSDTGNCIQAYFAPDSFSGQSSLNFFSNGTLIKTVAPNAHNEHMKGRHETGQVGFLVDESIIEGLPGIADLEIRDANTDILVYRREPAHKTIKQCVFRLETHLLPLWRLDAALSDKFRFWYQRIDQYSAETARQILSFHCFGSLFSSGRLLFKNYDLYITGHQKVIMILQDPYEELAERILIFNRLSVDAARLLGDRDAMVFAPIVTVAKTLKKFDEKELRSVLGQIDPQTLMILSDPITRQLISVSPSEPAQRGGIAKALRTASEFEITGIRKESPNFLEAVAETLQIDINELPPLNPNRQVEALARNLRAVRWIEGLIENDLELYDHIEKAYASA